jgi:hypothetical protein
MVALICPPNARFSKMPVFTCPIPKARFSKIVHCLESRKPDFQKLISSPLGKGRGQSEARGRGLSQAAKVERSEEEE